MCTSHYGEGVTRGPGVHTWMMCGLKVGTDGDGSLDKNDHMLQTAVVTKNYKKKKQNNFDKRIISITTDITELHSKNAFRLYRQLARVQHLGL